MRESKSAIKLSIVIICWNDLRVIGNCLHSIYSCTQSTRLEVVVSDNGSNDCSVDFIRQTYPKVRVLQNGTNLGFAKGNNAGIRKSQGQYVLILNPDTIVHEGSLEKLVEFADRHPEAGAFGCRVLNPDGSYQVSARLFPTIWRSWLAAFYLRRLASISNIFAMDMYPGWRGDSERPVDWQSGCCVMFRGNLLEELGGFDEQFFYHFEEVDLCRRVRSAGYPILFTPEATITHLGGQSVGRFPIRFAIERYRSRYKYFYKHYGARGLRHCQWFSLASIRVRQAGYGLIGFFKPSEAIRHRLETYRAVARWNRSLDPIRFVESGEEPDLDHHTVLQHS